MSTLIRPIAEVQPLADTDPPGTVRAIVAVFGNVDLHGDRIMPGAFDNWLARRRASGKAIPVLYSHDWTGAGSLLGYADPFDVEPVAKGLYVKFTLDLDAPWANVVYKLLREDALEYSFGYKVIRERQGKDGASELLELDLMEFGPCLRGVNPATETLSVKSSSGREDTRRDPRSGAAIWERVAAEEQIKALCASEGIVDPVEAQAKAERAEAARREQGLLLMAGQRKTALAMQHGLLDEVKIGPNCNIISGPIRRAQIDAEESREKATRKAERDQRDRDRSKSEATAEAARQSGPGIGGLRGKRVSS